MSEIQWHGVGQLCVQRMWTEHTPSTWQGLCPGCSLPLGHSSLRSLLVGLTPSCRSLLKCYPLREDFLDLSIKIATFIPLYPLTLFLFLYSAYHSCTVLYICIFVSLFISCLPNLKVSSTKAAISPAMWPYLSTHNGIWHIVGALQIMNEQTLRQYCSRESL